nr:immunoglobulin heavy chain junction region [Mus musculus]
TSVQDGTGPT